MHYILLAFALNFGKENIDLIKLSDMKVASKDQQAVIAKLKKTEKNEIANVPTIANLDDDNLIMNTPLPAEDNISKPYIESDKFAELLPEDELGNIKQTQTGSEEEGPKFIETIKNKLLKTTSNEPVLGSQIEGPGLLEDIKDKLNKKTETIAPVVDIKQTIATEEKAKTEPGFIDKIKNKIFGTTNEKNIAEKNKETTVGSQLEGPSFFDKNKIINKIEETVLSKKAIEQKNKSETDNKTKKQGKVAMVGTVFDSELNQALKDEKIILNKEILDKKIYENTTDIKYEDTEEYKKFLEEKEIQKLIKPELISVPDIKPREKEISSYKTQKVPQELLESRSFENRHIPKIMQEKEKQEILEKTIEYGLMEDFRAFMIDIKDANMLMDNQYTLLTYATKNKQYKIMEYLIFVGADTNKRDGRLETPLIVAVGNNDMKSVKILDEANAKLDPLDILKRTPLMYTIEKGYEDIGVYLIDHGSDVNLTNGINEGTLSMSIRLGRNAIKEKILEVLKNNKTNEIE